MQQVVIHTGPDVGKGLMDSLAACVHCSWPFQYFSWKHPRACGQDVFKVEK